MRPIWKNHWLLFRSTHSQKSPEKRDFVVHTHKRDTLNEHLFFCGLFLLSHPTPKSERYAGVIA